MKHLELIDKLYSLNNTHSNKLLKRYYLKKIFEDSTIEQLNELIGLELSIGIITKIYIGDNNIINLVINGENRMVYIPNSDIDTIIEYVIDNKILD